MGAAGVLQQVLVAVAVVTGPLGRQAACVEQLGDRAAGSAPPAGRACRCPAWSPRTSPCGPGGTGGASTRRGAPASSPARGAGRELAGAGGSAARAGGTCPFGTLPKRHPGNR